MNILTFDVETTIHNKGHWADKRNKLVMSGWKWLDGYRVHIIDHMLGNAKPYIQSQLDKADIVVGFNIKFDLHWMANIGVDLSNIKQVWDTQIAEFLLEGQRIPLYENSLNRALAKYGMPLKLDIIKTEYWDKGIDTIDIPLDILTEYQEYDVIGTENVFRRQWLQFVGTSL